MGNQKNNLTSLERLFSLEFQKWASDTRLSSFKNSCYDYVRWQNKAVQFYSASRLLFKFENYSPGGFCAFQFIENMLKATIMYYDGVDFSEGFGHSLKRMEGHINNKIVRKSSGMKKISIPDYFVYEGRYQQMTRYPRKGKGIIFTENTIIHIDKLCYELLLLVPFQFNTGLLKMIRDKDESIIERNEYIEKIKVYLSSCQIAQTADSTVYKLMEVFGNK